MEAIIDEVAEVLGVGKHRSLTKYEFSQLIQEGFPFKSVEMLTSVVAPHDKSFTYLLIPRATLNRRKREKVLTALESALLSRVAEVWAMARDVFGDMEQARRFLHEPHPFLDGETPINVTLQNEYGAEAVEDILGRLKYGSAA